MKKDELIIREWLNDKGDADTGAMMINLKLRDNYLEGEVKIRDCDRSITLHLRAGDAASKKKRLKKLDKMIVALEQARDFIYEAEIKKPKDGGFW